MKRRLLIALLFIAAMAILSITAAPASKVDNELTADEERESKALAELFVKRMAEKKDIAPILRELFADDFLDRYMTEPENESFLFIKGKLARSVSKSELQRYYTATMNFWYLNDLYVYSKFSSRSGNLPNQVGRIYAPAIARMIASLEMRMKQSRDKDSSNDVIASNAAELRSANVALEKLGALLRADVRRRKAETTATYKESVMDWDERFHHFKPWVTVCEKGCYGLPAGARLITINVPSFQLQISRVGAEFKIISAMPYID